MLLTVAGAHVPVIPLMSDDGKTGAVVPLQTGAVRLTLKVGTTLGTTVIFAVTISAHMPLLGVKVYVPEFVMVDGDHAPGIAGLVLEGIGNGGILPEHTDVGIGVLKNGTLTLFDDCECTTPL